MFSTKFKFAASVAIMAGAIGVGAKFLPFGASDLESLGAAAIVAADKNGDKEADKEELKLVNELLDAAKEEWKYRAKEYEQGRGSPSLLYDSARRLLQAELEKARAKDGRIAAWEAYVARVSEMDKLNTARFEAGLISAADYQESRFMRIEAELGLKKAKK